MPGRIKTPGLTQIKRGKDGEDAPNATVFAAGILFAKVGS